jgi:hypothetical protein
VKYLRRSFSVPVAGPSVTQEAWDAIFRRPFKGLQSLLSEDINGRDHEAFFDDLLSVYSNALKFEGPCTVNRDGQGWLTILDRAGRAVCQCSEETYQRLQAETFNNQTCDDQQPRAQFPCTHRWTPMFTDELSPEIYQNGKYRGFTIVGRRCLWCDRKELNEDRNF